MPRPKADGTPARAPRKRKLTELMVRKLQPEPTAYAVWDSYQRGLAVRVQPSGTRSWKIVYSRHGHPRWHHVGDAGSIPLADARRIAAKVILAVAEGKDPVAERQAERGGTFADLAHRYVEQYARRKNKSWQQADALVRRHLVPRWGKLKATSITRADVRTAIAGIAAPVVANQTMAAASAVFSWGMAQEVIAINPCHGVEKNAVRSRERVLADGEVPLFWNAFDDAGLIRSAALKTILLTGQRPGEVSHMRREHIVDGWWRMPGGPDPKLRWPGTKNGASHSVWLAEPVQSIIAELSDGEETGLVFVGAGKPSVVMGAICAKLGVDEKVTPHDLRRTFCSLVTGMGFGRDAMDRIANHKKRSVTDVYDRHAYRDEDRRIMEAVASRILALAEGRTGDDNVVQATFRR